MRVRLALWHSRSCALAAAVGILGHAAMVFDGSHGIWLILLAVAMIAACAQCVPKLWSSPSLQAAQMLTFTSLGMVVIHGLLVVGGIPSLSHGHGSADTLSEGLTMDGGMNSAFPLMAIEFGIALLGATLVRSLRQRASAGTK